MCWLPVQRGISTALDSLKLTGARSFSKNLATSVAFSFPLLPIYSSVAFFSLVNDLFRFLLHPAWIKIQGANSALIRASLKTENRTYNCIGTVLAKNGCWSFLKGGFVLDSPLNLALLLFQNSDDKDIDITIDSSSLQPFTDQEWRFNQQFMINTQRKRAVTIHVSDQQGNRLQGAVITINQVSKDFPFGSAIAHTILGKLPYQNWFVE
ncbi:hypothetical protein ES288_D12G243400v1 [Gossypium darwinii]|uniref:Uncharacterized protein n=1 Tax=Gossypium darwinii TaxID=34276 RepID=A0A5D2ABR4_GOSDA|nr:hypothetical protein ES288_D12G243400v1 [Gossypium darwinii]